MLYLHAHEHGLGNSHDPSGACGWSRQGARVLGAIWLRLRATRSQSSAGIFIVVMFVVAFIGAPIAAQMLGHGPNDQFINGVDPNTFLPVGPWTWVARPMARQEPAHPRCRQHDRSGSVPAIALRCPDVARGRCVRDVILHRIGVFCGALAGYFRGGVDTVMARLRKWSWRSRLSCSSSRFRPPWASS